MLLFNSKACYRSRAIPLETSIGQRTEIYSGIARSSLR